MIALLALASACERSDETCVFGETSCRGDRICAFVEPGVTRCMAFATREEPLAPPLPEGSSFWCSQGGLSAPGRTHSYSRDAFALDLTSTTDGPVPIVSPVDGTAHVFDSCEERETGIDAHNNSRCGLGYGNHVKIWDGQQLYLFAHLAHVHITPGPVQRGQPLGTMGNSGAAGHRHLHLALTRPSAGLDLEEILKTPGWTGDVPVRFRLSVTSSLGKRESVWSDELPCADTLEHAVLFTP